MKKLISAAAVLAAMGALTFTSFADTTVHVTISDAEGNLAVADRTVTVSDIDEDGALTINDALYAAHELYYSQGAAGGYETATGDYGLMITKLWGTENGGSYGYYVNNASAFSLSDPVSDGDYLNAFVYTDLTAWSDTYCYFDKNDYISGDGLVELTLSGAGFDDDWNPITVPIEGAEITVNGEKTGAVTDANGKAVLQFTKDQEALISAVSDTQTLVPPVCRAYIQIASNSAAEVTAASDVSAEAASSKGSPDTGIADVAAVAGIAIVAAGALVVTKKRK